MSYSTPSGGPGLQTAAVTAARAGGRKAPRLGRRRLTFDYVSFLLVFLVLPVALFLVFVISPFIQAVYYSMTNWTGFSPNMSFVGLNNFVKLFQDSTFLQAMTNNALLAIVVPLITIVIALVFASMITVGGPSHGQVRGLTGSSFYRVVSFFPYVIPAIVIAILWSMIYAPNGLLNGALGFLGIDTNSFAWLGDQSTAMGATIFVIVWSMVGFYMVLFIAAIKGIPAETLEAARIDGAGRYRTVVSILLPQIRDNVQTAYIYLGIMALDAFVYMAGLNASGGPNNSTLVMSQYLFRTAFEKGQFGLASAMGVVLAILTLVFAGLVIGVFRLVGGKDEGGRA
ncbi:carbohydrate ABC transporter permease [Microbacterium azadirachtae]|uniref:sn-glycerol-3-phosphate transport system permease protein UgpA n=1 Tax=Microbacterium azadirachtae TaxID=582680 RepID=A0A0F0L9V3_9MICO|nr:sugar ABC transporter permease [Microbacterium azadirachtae]KJL29459.1 sn-glycerol-3-phosphate transport system permease protein UgpA [Microbacterium azadirachtae]SDM47816.1 carbohydrate ABC transporter membrane protein 1, CUT1 family [Microbacterium azadirachtae]SEG60056.1 carbohydrate ABC transporter membrane protein 1, CUT1 family [Microbacterium azadirachtae]SEG61764.1 carbohydrate ABC transporter membrane protein 1, CUT1 family [Microbacterium azadirachtae]